MTLLSHDLFIFDLDGTIIDSEDAHFRAYNSLLPNNKKLTFSQYHTIFHCPLKKSQFKVENDLHLEAKDTIFKEIYEPKYITGFIEFLSQLIIRNKTIIIVTNTNPERIAHIKSLHPILSAINEWFYPLEDAENKPAIKMFERALAKYRPSNPIIFEDSWTGYCAVRDLKTAGHDVASVFICQPSYPYYEDMKDVKKICDYTEIIVAS